MYKLAGTVSVIQVIVKYEKKLNISQSMQFWQRVTVISERESDAWFLMFYHWQALIYYYLQVIVGYLMEVSMQQLSQKLIHLVKWTT